MQAIQEVFRAKEWVNDTRNEARVEANLHAEANQALGASKQKNKELAYGSLIMIYLHITF